MTRVACATVGQRRLDQHVVRLLFFQWERTILFFTHHDVKTKYDVFWSADRMLDIMVWTNIYNPRKASTRLPFGFGHPGTAKGAGPSIFRFQAAAGLATLSYKLDGLAFNRVTRPPPTPRLRQSNLVCSKWRIGQFQSKLLWNASIKATKHQKNTIRPAASFLRTAPQGASVSIELEASGSSALLSATHQGTLGMSVLRFPTCPHARMGCPQIP